LGAGHPARRVVDVVRSGLIHYGTLSGAPPMAALVWRARWAFGVGPLSPPRYELPAVISRVPGPRLESVPSLAGRCTTGADGLNLSRSIGIGNFRGTKPAAFGWSPTNEDTPWRWNGTWSKPALPLSDARSVFRCLLWGSNALIGWSPRLSLPPTWFVSNPPPWTCPCRINPRHHLSYW